MEYQQLYRKRVIHIYDSILAFLAEFNGDFIFGLITGVMAVSVVIYRFKGLSFAMSPYGQFHLVSIDIFFSLIPISYSLLRFEEDNGKRVLASIMMPILALSMHDVSWLIETFWVPQIYFNGKTILGASLEEYVYNFSKNLVNIIPSLMVFLKYKYFRINRTTLVLFGVMMLFHSVNIIFQVNLYIQNGVALILMEMIDVVPWLFLIKKNGGFPQLKQVFQPLCFN